MAVTDDVTLAALLAQHDYAGAATHLRQVMDSGRRDAAIRFRLVDVLVAGGRGAEAAAELMSLADQYDAAGQAAKAIALLKRAEIVAADPFESSRRLDALVLRSVSPAPHSELAAEGAPTAAPRALRRPLLAGLTGEELLALVRGLRLHAFQPGDIVFAEGEPGRSLFVVASGSVKVFVRDPSGHPVLLRELLEGTFFGEIALLTGAPRSATVTAATRTELLELDRATLDAIAATHPRVGEVIRDTAKARSGSEAETRARAGEPGRS